MQKRLLILFFLGITVLIFLGLHQIYTSIYRLSLGQISNYVSSVKPTCTTIKECQLLPGDILIRRYITSRTKLFDSLTHPYFTHTAFYMGNNSIIEAGGNEINKAEEIKELQLSSSDWFADDIPSFIIVRPRNYHGKLPIIQDNLKKIADDPQYRFGLPLFQAKTTTCSDLIYSQLVIEHMVAGEHHPSIITPDYLFWIMMNNPNDFEIIGYTLADEYP